MYILVYFCNWYTKKIIYKNLAKNYFSTLVYTCFQVTNFPPSIPLLAYSPRPNRHPPKVVHKIQQNTSEPILNH